MPLPDPRPAASPDGPQPMSPPPKPAPKLSPPPRQGPPPPLFVFFSVHVFLPVRVSPPPIEFGKCFFFFLPKFGVSFPSFYFLSPFPLPFIPGVRAPPRERQTA